jgi:hypothetical protein
MSGMFYICACRCDSLFRSFHSLFIEIPSNDFVETNVALSLSRRQHPVRMNYDPATKVVVEGGGPSSDINVMGKLSWNASS